MSRMHAEEADIVVVGGGVIGLALAFELARRGRPPLVIERGRTGGEATWAAAGMLAPNSEVELEPAVLVELGHDSLRRYPAFVADLEKLAGMSCHYRTDGTLWVALNRDEAEELDHLEATLKTRSLAVSRLDAHEVLDREPHLSGRIVGGLAVPHDVQVDPRALARCLEKAVARLGGEVRHGTTAIEVEGRGPGRFQIRCRVGATEAVLACSRLVVAAGAWTSEGSLLPLDGLGVRPVKGQLVRLRGTELLRHVVRHPECYLVPREDGELLVGATVEEQGFDTTPTAGAVLDLLRHAWQVAPGLYDLQLAEISVGLRPAVADQLPVIGETEVEGLYLATGHFRHGILLAPATAHYLAEGIAGGEIPPVLEPFAPDRLRDARQVSP